MLPHLPLDPCLKDQITSIDPVRDDRTQRGKCIRPLSPGPLPVLFQHGPVCHIIDAGVSKHMVQCFFLRNFAAPFPHHHCQFPFKVDRMGRIRTDDPIIRPNDRGTRLYKKSGAGGRIHMFAAQVGFVICAHPHDLPRLTGRQQFCLPQSVLSSNQPVL